MYLLSLPHTPQSATFTSVTDTAPIYDTDLDTFVETPNTAPTLVIDLGAARRVDTLFLKGANLHGFTLAGSNNNSAYTNLDMTQTAPSHGNVFRTFTNTVAYRYYRLTFSARQGTDPAYRMHEVYLMSMILDIDNDNDRPPINQITLPGDHVVAYDAYNDATIEYRLQGGNAKVQLTFGWEQLDETVADALAAIYAGDPIAPELTVYPQPGAEPDKIYRAKWVSDVNFTPSQVKTSPAPNGDIIASLLMRGQVRMEEI